MTDRVNTPAGIVASSSQVSGTASYAEWGSIFAGAVAALAVSVVLLSFGAGIGLSAVSPWNSAPGTITAVGIGSAFWILLVSIWSFALGGYLAARLRHRASVGDADEIAFRDNAHGMLAWALAVTLAAVVTAGAAGLARSGSGAASSSPAAVTAVDTIVRTTRADVPPASEALRGEVSRALMAGPGQPKLGAADQAFLTSVVARRSGLAETDASQRVARAFNVMRQATDRARKAGIVMAFLAAASLLVGGAAAWWAAGVGGRHRDDGTVWEVFARGPARRLT